MSLTTKNTQEKITKRAKVVCDKITPQTILSIIDLIDQTRVKLGLSITSFATLLSMPVPSYYRMAEGQTLNALVLLRFCAIFGYDLESVVSGPIPTAFDLQSLEFASWVGSLPDSALQDIRRVIDGNPDISKVDKRLFNEALTEYRQRRQEYIDQLTDDAQTDEN